MKALKSLGALLALVVLVIGVPLGLVAMGGSPIPETLPTGNQVISALTNPNFSVLIPLVLTYVGWIAWLSFIIPLAVQLPAAIKGIKAPELPGFGLQQRLAAVLLGAIAFTAVPQVAMAAPAGPAVDTQIAQALFTPQGGAGGAISTQTQGAHPGPYTVQDGDSLFGLAQKYLGDGQRWHEIAALNYGVTQADGSALGASHALESGWVLQLPEDAVDPEIVGVTTIEHTVVPGDTLWDIAERYLGDGMRWPELHEAMRDTVQPDGRQIVDPDLIYPGWVVTVPGVTNTGAAGSDTQGAGYDPNAGDILGGEGGAAAGTGVTLEGEVASDVDEQLSAQTVGGAGGVLAAGVIGVLAYKRRETQRRRTAGMRLQMPEPGSTAALLESQMRAIADPMSLQVVDRVLRALSDYHHDHNLRLPDIRAARMSPESFEIYLGSPATLPSPWKGSADQVVWTVDAAGAAGIVPSATATAPYPTLVTVGVDDSGAHVMLDMEHVSSLDIRGDEEVAHASIAALAAELATTPWADDLQVTLVGTLPELGAVLDTGRVRHVPSLDRVIRELEKRADAVKRALDAAGVESIPAARGAGVLEDAWTPEVVLVGGDIPAELRDRLEALLERVPRVGIAAITAGDSGEWALELDPANPQRATLEPANLEVRVQQLTPQEYADVLSIISGSHKVVPGPTWAANLISQEPTVTELSTVKSAPAKGRSAEPAESAETGRVPSQAAQKTSDFTVPTAPTASIPDDEQDAPAHVRQLRHPRVRVLGDVLLEAPAGTELAEKDRSQALELIAYLALTPGATNDQLSAALWPGREAKNATRNSAVSRARRWLGSDHTGNPYLPIATTAENFGTYSLTGVATDWDQFIALMGDDAAATSTEDLRTALGLVRGRPFANARAGKYSWAEPHAQEMIASIVDVSNEVARRCLLDGDADGARWASAVGLAVTPDDERLWRNAIRAEYMDGDQQALWGLVKRCYDYLEELDVEPESETEALVAELRTAAARPRSADSPAEARVVHG